MRIYLNLLPDNRKKDLSRKIRLKNIVKQEVLFLLPIVLFVGILLSINLVLEVQNNGIASVLATTDSQNNYQDLKLYEEGFKRVNTKVANINKLQSGHLRWSGPLDLLIKSVPEGIYFTDLSTNGYKFLLAGKANERESLIEFQENISGAECFENVNVPLSNLVSRDNIDFQMDFDVKRECLINKK